MQRSLTTPFARGLFWPKPDPATFTEPDEGVAVSTEIDEEHLPNQSLPRVALMTLVLSVGACIPQATATPSTFPDTANERVTLAVSSVEVAMEDVGFQVGASGNVDLSTEWADLSHDMTSAVADLVEDPTSVDTVGLTRRISSFVTRLDSDTDSSGVGARLLNAFQSFLGRLPQPTGTSS